MEVLKGNGQNLISKTFTKKWKGSKNYQIWAKTKKWIECYLSKCEANYSSYYKADTDEKGAAKIALECNDDIIK
jgi:hypothetical protein